MDLYIKFRISNHITVISTWCVMTLQNYIPRSVISTIVINVPSLAYSHACFILLGAHTYPHVHVFPRLLHNC